MRWQTTAVLALLLAGLGTFYYVYEVRQAPEREKAAAVKDRLWKDLDQKDIEEVVVRKPGETVHLKKAGDRWSLVAPVSASAERRPVDDLTASIATVRVEREIEANPAKLADYGLDPPAVELTVVGKGQTRALRLGAKNPTGIWAYAQESGKPAVFLVPEGLLRDAQKPANDFRDHALLAFERKDVRSLEVAAPGRPAIAAALRDKDEWQLTAPMTVAADRDAISGLLAKLRDAKIKEFVTDAPKSPAEYGLDHPTRIGLTLGEEKARVTKALRLGRAVPDKKAFYAQREGEPTVLLVDEELGKAVPTTVTAWRDKTVFAFDRGKIERLEVDSPKGRVALALHDGKWQLTAPVALRAEESAVSDLLWKARDLRVKEFLAEDARRLAAYGLDRPQVRLSVWEKDAKDPKTLLLAPGRAGDQAVATAVGPGAGFGGVAAVDAKALGDLTRSATDLRDHSLAEAFETKDVARITIQRPSQTLALERTGSGEEDWALASPKKGRARGGRVSELVWTFRNLKWKELVAERDWDPARYGLDAGATTVTLLAKDGKTIAALALGKREGPLTYVRVPGQPALYAIETKSLGDLPATPEELLL